MEAQQERQTVEVPAHFGLCLDKYYQITVQMKISDMISLFQVDPQVQRDVIEPKVKSLTDYIEEGIGQDLIFLPPFIVSWRNIDINELKFNKEKRVLIIPDDAELYINDGQHRFASLIRMKKGWKIKQRGRLMQKSMNLCCGWKGNF